MLDDSSSLFIKFINNKNHNIQFELNSFVKEVEAYISKLLDKQI